MSTVCKTTGPEELREKILNALQEQSPGRITGSLVVYLTRNINGERKEVYSPGRDNILVHEIPKNQTNLRYGIDIKPTRELIYVDFVNLLTPEELPVVAGKMREYGFDL